MAVGEIYAGISSFKVMLDIAKGLKDLSDASSRYAAVIDLQEKILGAQEAQTALIQKVSQLEAQMAEFEEWDAEKQRYNLKEVGSSGFAYVLKPEASNGEPPHALCTNCYRKRIKSSLQSNGNPYLDKHRFDCPSCGSAFNFKLSAMQIALGLPA